MIYKVEREVRSLDPWILLVYGPPKVGKTVSALTASTRYPDEKSLDDILFLEFDPGGLDSVKAMGYDVPYFDLSRIDVEKFITDIGSNFEDALKKQIKAGTKTLVVDTLTAYNSSLVSHFTEKFPSPGHKGLVYNGVLNGHMKLYQVLLRSGCNLLLFAHAQYLIDLEAKGAGSGEKKRAETMPGENAVKPRISGQMSGHYSSAASIQAAMLAVPGPGNVMKRWLNLDKEGWETGHRFPALGKREEPHYLKLVEKAKKGKQE